MPRSPTGSRETGISKATTTLGVDDFMFLQGIEAGIDRALERHRPGESFVYGIHQELSEPIASALCARYRAVGWSDVRVRQGETGAHTIVLIP